MPNPPVGLPHVISGPGSNGSGCVRPPRYPTRFVGRRAEVTALLGLLGPGRLVTVVGLGGAGKTRMAAELGSNHDCVWVDVSEASEPADVASALSKALGLPAGGSTDLTLGVLNVLRGQPMLLVIDNCEVQRAPCRELVDALLGETETLSVLATSRVPLDSAYEWLYPLPPLAEGDDFADRAARVGYAPAAQDKPVVMGYAAGSAAHHWRSNSSPPGRTSGHLPTYYGASRRSWLPALPPCCPGTAT